MAETEQQLQTIKGEDANLPAQSAGLTPVEMLASAVRSGADIQVVERLSLLYERWEAERERHAFVEALAAFKKNPPTIIKSRKAGFESKRTGDSVGYEYADLAAVANVIAPALTEHGLSHRWETEHLESGSIKVTCVLEHVQGHSERASLQGMPDNSGSKNPLQAVGSTISYLEKYTLLGVTGLAARGQDDDGGAGGGDPMVDADQLAELEKLVSESNSDVEKFCAYMKVESLSQLPASKFERAKKALERKRDEPPGEEDG